MAIYVTRSSMPSFEEYIEEIRPIFESRHMTNMGPIYQNLKTMIKDYLDVPLVSMFVNGHMALEIAIQAMGLNQPGGEVITTPFTFVSTTHAISRNGLKPVFCDIDPETYTMDVTKIEELITDRTVAIVPVHVYGNICDVEEIEAIAKKHNLKVIYDAAHAFGVTYKGKGIGNYGDASMFSFHATKVFNTIEGGCITYQDESYRVNLANYKNFGLTSDELHVDIAPNAKMDEFRAAMGVCNLRNIETSISKRKSVAEHYDSYFKDVEGITINTVQEDVISNYAYYPILVDAKVFGKTRDDIFNELMKHDIYSRKYFYPAINEMSCYKELGEEYPTPVAHKISMDVLTLPLFEDLTMEDVDRICSIILG